MNTELGGGFLLRRVSGKCHKYTHKCKHTVAAVELWKHFWRMCVALPLPFAVNSRSTDILQSWQQRWTQPRHRGHIRLPTGCLALLAPSLCRFITLLIWTKQWSRQAYYSAPCRPLCFFHGHLVEEVQQRLYSDGHRGAKWGFILNEILCILRNNAEKKNHSAILSGFWHLRAER